MQRIGGFFPRGAHVLAAVSGGADSMAMLHLLKELRDAGEISLTAAHFEHGIRGEESRSDMRFVEGYCREIGVACIVGSGDVPAEAKRRHMGLEEAAREMRRAFLLGAMREAGADWISTAHHEADQAETVLMRLLRGSSPAGLGGMREKDGVWAKPMLGWKKTEIIAYLRERGIPWREDETNAEEGTPRNALRLRILPQMEEIFPGAQGAIARYAKMQAIESDFLDETARAWLGKSSVPDLLGRMISLEKMPHEAVLRRALKIAAGRDAQFSDIEKLCALCRKGRGKLDLRGEKHAQAEIRGGSLWLTDKFSGCEPVPVQENGETFFGKWGTLSACAGAGTPIKDDPFAQEIAAEKLAGAVLRFWQPGDRIRPLGMGGRSRLLSDLYADKKIPAPRRRMQVVLEQDGEMIWAIGACISERAKLTGKGPSARLQWRPGGVHENTPDKNGGGTEQ